MAGASCTFSGLMKVVPLQLHRAQLKTRKSQYYNTEASRDGGRTMPSPKGIVFAFRPFGKPSESRSLPQCVHFVAPSSQYLVWVRLHYRHNGHSILPTNTRFIRLRSECKERSISGCEVVCISFQCVETSVGDSC